MISIKARGSFDKTSKFLNGLLHGDMFNELDQYGQMGVDALSRVTPVESGLTARSWRYKINIGRKRTSIEWYNTNENNGANVAILLQYGHATGNGGYVSGYDYINPAMRPVFDQISERVWSKVTSL